jgi:hypothetical protein
MISFILRIIEVLILVKQRIAAITVGEVPSQEDLDKVNARLLILEEMK